MRYYLIAPNGNEVEITGSIIKGVDNISEIAFDLENVNVPSDLNVEVDNSEGQYDQTRGLFVAGEMTKFIMLVTGEKREQVLFIGTVTDLKYSETSKCEIETRSVIASVIACSFNMAIFVGQPEYVAGSPARVEATPARLVQMLLGPDGVHLPCVFLDSEMFSNYDAAEQNLGLKIKLSIPDGENMVISDFLQELNRVTGAYVYSFNGYINYTRYGGFDRDGYDHTFAGEVIAGTVKHSRPVLWQKTKIKAKYWDGSAAVDITKTMPDYFDVIGDTIMENFREKVIETDGIGGWLIHANLTSANAGLQDVLGWRGFPRWQFEFEVDAIGEDVRSKAQGIPLLSKIRLLWSGGCTKLALIEKTVNDQKATIKGMSLSDPTFIHPARRKFPVVTQVWDTIEFFNNTGADMKLYWRYESDETFTTALLTNDTTVTISAGDGTDQIIYYVTEGLPCGELPSEIRTFTPEPVAHFILGTSMLGDQIG